MPGVPEDVPFEERLVRELPLVHAYLWKVSGGRDVDDLVQETAARALKYKASYDRRRELALWLRGVALRVLLDHRARVRLAPEALETAPFAAEGPRAELEVREEVQSALQRLSEIERDVVVRFHAREQSLREIAAALRIPEGTVKSHLHRARVKLAQSESR